jgi:GT2 family glycosyltransferase
LVVSIRSLSHQAQYGRPWFYFDADFYIAQCIEAGITPALGSPDLLLQHYFDRGARLGLSPNPLFDEEYYRRKYPDMVRELQLGAWMSGFEHFVDVGAAADYTPVWFFDGSFYLSRNPDLNDENLRSGAFPDRYTHYLLSGASEQRLAHWTVEMLHKVTGEFRFPTDIAQLCDLVVDGGQLPDMFRPLFDYAWMTEKYDWGRSVRPGGFVRHYLFNVNAQALSPSPYFDEAYYVANEAGVEASIAGGVFACGYEHFLLLGMNEWRKPFAAFDPHYYFATNMNASPADIGLAPAQSPFVHFLRNRGRRNFPLSPPLADRDVPEDAGKAVYERRCAINAARLGDLTFAPAGTVPDVSILIVARDGFAQTANCIVSAVYATRASVEVILFDNGSTDDIRNIPAIHPGIRYLRAEENLGFTVAVNRAAEVASGRMILLLNNDAEVTAGAIDIALRTLDADPAIGAVGAKIVRMHGRLQEAGSLIWQDGSCLGYGRDGDPLDGQVGFIRDVDFCSGCFLGVTRAAWEELAGFDEAYAPAYYEETDFCVRLWQSGRRVVYDPRIVVWHFEFGTSTIREEPLALMRRNQRYFASKHRSYLAACLPPSPANIERARLRHAGHPRILFVEDMLPDPNKGMGFTRSAAIARHLEQFSGLTSVLGLHDGKWPASLPGDRSGRRVEILTGVNAINAAQLLRARSGLYDIMWLSRTHNLPLLREWRAACPEFFATIRIVLDTEAIAAMRRFAYAQQAGQAGQGGQGADLAEMVSRELEHLDGVGHICVVNELDRQLVQAVLDLRGSTIPISVLGHALPVTPRPPAFADTSTIVLAGSYSAQDSPNADGLLWFDRAVRPLIKDLPGLEFVVAGSEAARFTASAGLQHDYRVIDNPPDMSEIYRTARLMIAPTRFAAGLPMKVHEAASQGVPVVMTDLLGRQLGWSGKDITVAPPEPEAMARAVEKLALDGKAWRRTQLRQLELVAADCDPMTFGAAIGRIVGASHEPSTTSYGS